MVLPGLVPSWLGTRKSPAKPSFGVIITVRAAKKGDLLFYIVRAVAQLTFSFLVFNSCYFLSLNSSL